MSDERVTWRGAPSEAQTSGPRFTARSLLLQPVLERARPEKAIDIGCGRGAVTRILARHAGSVLATEVTDQGVQAAKEALRDCVNVDVRLANLFDGGTDDLSSEGPFDLVLLSEVLEHLENDSDALEKIHGLLADDALLVITVPRDPSFWSVEDELWDHKRRYTRDELSSKLQAAGFKTETFWSWGFPFTRRVVQYQVSRLRPKGEEVRAGPPRVMRPPKLLLPFLRLAFAAIARFEQLFRGSDRGIGYVVSARKVAPGSD